MSLTKIEDLSIVLDIMGIEKPKEMTENSLIK